MKAKVDTRVMVGIDRQYWRVLRALKVRDGVSFRWQVERAITLLAAEKGIALPTKGTR